MSHSVDRLKELLFETEARTLSDVQQRLSKSETDLLSHSKEREVFAERLDAVFTRAGTEERFRQAVAQVLDRALRQAETDRHAELSEAVAPLIVRTIRTEISNSRDELVDALYPITGRMVKAYVASAIADLAAEINRRVDSNPALLRLRSLLTGKSVAQLALADSGTTRVEDVYLIRRGTGELLAHWAPEEQIRGQDDRSQILSSVLAAINEFATDAFGADGASLREIDLGDARVYLRASPLYLLAARCTGAAQPAAAALLDDSLLRAIERCHTQMKSSAEARDATYVRQIHGLADELSTQLAKLTGTTRRRVVSPALVLFGIAGTAVTAIVAWHVIDHHFVTGARNATRSAITAAPGTTGYPINVDIEPFARRVSLSGLTRDDDVKQDVLRRVRNALPGSNVVDHLTPLPGVQGTIGPAIERAEIAAALQRMAQRLEQVGRDLSQLAAVPRHNGHIRSLSEAENLVSDSIADLQSPESELQTKPEEQTKLADELQQQAAELTAVMSGREFRREPARPIQSLSAIESARRLEVAADQLAIVTAAALHAAQFEAAPPPPSAVRAPEPTAFDRLSQFARSHAVFFTDGLAYHADADATSTLDELARLMRDSEALVRVVGYTDAKGSTDRNNELSDGRARKVMEELVARGIPTSRLVVVGRQDSLRISSGTGDANPNRRVEFELGFVGEARQ